MVETCCLIRQMDSVVLIYSCAETDIGFIYINTQWNVRRKNISQVSACNELHGTVYLLRS